MSLEEEEEEEELQDAAQNVVTLDGEVMAVNGRILAGHHQAHNRTFNPGREPDAVSVCSCTCYGTKQKEKIQRKGTVVVVRRAKPVYIRLWNRLIRRLGCADASGPSSEDGNYYDEETQSINNHARFAVKRASF